MPGISLATRLVLLLSLCIAGTLALTTAVEYRQSRGEILREVEASTEGRVSEVVNDLELRLAGIADSADLFAELLAQRPYSEQELTAMLREVVDERGDIYGAAIALDPAASQDAGGFAIYYHYREDGSLVFTDLTGGYDYTGRDWYRGAVDSGAPRWSEPYFDDGGGEVLMSTYSVPMYREVAGRRQLYGVVTADISLATLQVYIDRMQIGETGFGFLLSRAGKLMAVRDPGNLMQPLLEVLPASEDRAQWQRWLEDTARGETVSARLPCQAVSGDCRMKLTPLVSTRWPVGAYYSEYEVLAPLREYLVSALISGGVTLALLLVAILWVSRRITRPLRQLAAASADIATGNFHTPLPQPESTDELGRLVKAFSMMQDNLQHYVAQLEVEIAARNRLEGELDAAAGIQQAMLPQGDQALVEDPRFTLWARLSPARVVGGDLYTYNIQDNGVLLAVGDVSDKGIAAALFMARATTLLQQHGKGRVAPAALMSELNEALVEGNEACMFVTLFIGWLDLDSDLLTFSSAGHTAPRLVRDAGCLVIDQQRGPALGLKGGLAFPENRLSLRPGDRLALFTDGVEEAFDDAGEQFGLARLDAELARGAGSGPASFGAALFDTLSNHSGAAGQSDDIALLLVDRAGDTGSFRLDNPLLVSEVQQWLTVTAATLGLSADRLRDLLLVAEEGVTNIRKYARLPGSAEVELQLGRGAEGPWLQLRDAGQPFDPAAHLESSPARDGGGTGGHGVHLLLALADRYDYRRDGGHNVLRLSWRDRAGDD
jgi:sigma-B regulation protein RsbU (phosphoserine phosphatase)